MMWVQLEEILNEREISTFEGGRYTDEVRSLLQSTSKRYFYQRHGVDNQNCSKETWKC